MGIIALIRFKGLPCSKSAPREVCALIILSVSSRSIGMKRSAMLIIITKTEIGTPIFFNGERSTSIPPASTVGVVVSVRSELPIISRIILTAIFAARATPSAVIVINPFEKSTLSPVVRNRFKSAVIITISIIGFKPLSINLRGMLDTFIKTAVISIITTYDTRPSIANNAII